jgi:hypothetical protein
MIEWTRSTTIGLAHPKCARCHGLGLNSTQKCRGGRACNCVLRAVFRICYNRFRFCLEKERHMSHTSLDFSPGGTVRRYHWARKDEEYVADFFLVARRTLNDQEWRLFRFHYMLGADWKLCCRRLGMDRGSFFHAVYRIQQQLGKVFSELEPYGLYPVDEYFGGKVRSREFVSYLDSDPLPLGADPMEPRRGGFTPVPRGEDGRPITRVVPIRPPVTARPAPEVAEEPKAA